MTAHEKGQQRMTKRWSDFAGGTAKEGVLGRRVMETAGETYYPTEAEIRAAGLYRGAVNPCVADALRGGNFSRTAVTLIATDIMNKWTTKTQQAKNATMKVFFAFLGATGRERIFFPTREDLNEGKWRQPSAASEEQTLTEFAIMRVIAGCAPETAEGAVSNVRTWCRMMMDRSYGKVGENGRASMTSEFIKAMKQSMFFPDKNSKDTRREPITWDMVVMFMAAAEREGREDVGVTIAIAFAGLFRVGELTSTTSAPFSSAEGLSERDAVFLPTFWTANEVVFDIGRTKADQSGRRGKLRPRTLPVEPGSPGGLLRRMLARRHGVADGVEPTLRPVPLFQNGKRAQLTRDSVMRFIRKVLRQAGWSEARCARYGTHSCRIGGCTALLELGASAEVIQSMGGWSSDAYKVYMRLKQRHLMTFSRRMCV